MGRFGFCGASYQSQSVNADAQVCMNWYVESLESGDGKSSKTLYPTPGLVTFATLAGPSVRGQWTISGRLFAVAGTKLYEIFSNGTSVSRGTVIDDGLPASMTASNIHLLIASGGTTYVLTLATNVFATVAIPNSGALSISTVGFDDGFFLALVKNDNRIFISNVLDATGWLGTAVVQTSVFPDLITSMIVDHREIAVGGAKASIVYYDSGSSSIFDVIPGSYIEVGSAATYGVAKLDNSVFWIGKDERGQGIGWKAQGYTPQRVTTHAIELAWSQYATISDAVSYAYQEQGHSFWVIFFPTANKTWAYDAATNLWHERGYWNTQTGTFTGHRSWNHVFTFGKHLVGDWNSAKIYQMAVTLYDDAGNPLRRVRRAPHIASEAEWIFHSQMQVDMETGLGPQPPLQGTGASTIITLKDSNNALWSLSVNDSGVLQTQAAGSASAAETVTLKNGANTVSWQLGVTIGGVLTTTSVAFNPANPISFSMVSVTGQTAWDLGVTTGGNLTTTKNLAVLARGPQVTLRWSDDGGHTWSNGYDKDCGQAGNFKTRVIWRRLGRSRDRVYELSASDPVPYRIIDSYLQAAPGYAPSERLVSQYRKIA